MRDDLHPIADSATLTNSVHRLVRRVASEFSLGLVPVLTLVPASIVVLFLYLSLKVSILAGLGVVSAFAVPVSYYIYRRQQQSLKALTSPGGWVSKKEKNRENQ